MKPWHNIPIIENNEKLIPIPKVLRFLKPHPYVNSGAPYKNIFNPWNLREGVVSRLLKVNDYLKNQKTQYSLILYDTWRPLEVQAYMFDLAFLTLSRKRGLNISLNEKRLYPEILKEVEQFWAYPSKDKKNPPPHSTGGAIDLTMIDNCGNLVDMGCDIDDMDDTAKPDFYLKSKNGLKFLWNQRRSILRNAMTRFGFAQHPNEWWHFSYGDQLWAWKNNKENAFYGTI